MRANAPLIAKGDCTVALLIASKVFSRWLVSHILDVLATKLIR